MSIRFQPTRPAIPYVVQARDRWDRVDRVFNVILASVALLFLAPLMIGVGIAIKFTSPGPILHVQIRIGQNRRRRTQPCGIDRRARDLGGRPFKIYKFRSMYCDAEMQTGAVWATSADERVTPLGRFLRRSRLDELPQLINVVTGDMNIVGPRPERPSIFAQLRADVSLYTLRQLGKPGLTGLAQVSQPYDRCVDDVRRKVVYDLRYLARKSVLEDVRIMLRTVPVMIFRNGGW